MENKFPESQLAHKWLDGLSGLEIGPSSHNPFGLNAKNVGLIDHVYQNEQQMLVGEVAKLDIVADAQAIPLPSESEEFVLSSHVIEHCPNMIQALLEWYRVLKPGGLLYLVTPHREAAPSDRGRPLTTWDHLFSDYLVNMNSEVESGAGTFLHCHYHVFDLDSMKGHFQAIFDSRMRLVEQREVDDKIGNGFVLLYKKEVPLLQAFPWTIEGQKQKAYVSRPCDFYALKEVNPVGLPKSQDVVLLDTQDQEIRTKALSHHNKEWHHRPLVSAIMTVYKAERFMRGALEDLLGQTIADQTEIIIVDTDSPEREQDIAREFQEKHNNIVYIRTGLRESPPQAFNLGLRYARGKYITFANSDDRHRTDAFEVMIRELETHPEVALVYGDVWVTRFENQKFGQHIRTGYHIRPEFSEEIMLSGCHMGPQPMWRRSVHEHLGEFEGMLDSAADYEFWCRMALHYPFKHIPQFLGLYYDNPNGMVNANHQKNRDQTITIQRRYAERFPPSSQLFINNYHFIGPVQKGKFVNIGMVTFNRLEFTKLAIASLLKYTCFPHMLTVVDNGSSDGTREYLKSLQHEGMITHLILLESNVGIAKASNLAWAEVPQADYYLKLDNDIVIQKPGWLSNMVEVIDRIPELGAVAYNFEPVSYPVHEIQELRFRPKDGSLGGACVLIPKRTHQTLGFWCEDYGFYGEEDADYGLRIRLQGWRNAYMADEQVGLHLPAGRAAHIDEQTLKATDGVEENTHAEYRAFKDECRQKNVREIAKKNFQDYQAGEKPLYCSSSFLLEFQKNAKCSGRPVVPCSTQAKMVEKPKVNNPENINHGSQLGSRQVSAILSDNICGMIRLVQPLLAGRNVWEKGQIVCEGEILLGKTFLSAGRGHVWVLQRTSVLAEQYLKDVQAQGTRIIHDCDDLLWEVPPDNSNYRILTSERLEAMFRLMAVADCVTVSTEPIQVDLKKRGISAVVLPNCLLRQEWEDFRPQRRAGSRPRIGWAGQVKVHKADTAILETIIEELKDEVEWVFLGEAPRTVLSPGVLSETFSMVELAHYPKKLASLNLDLALAPLVPNRFNEAKSDIRILQYGILGYPVIGTDIYAHQQAPILRLPHEPQAWIQAIRERIHDLDALEREGDKLRQWVLAHRLIEHVLPKYERAWLGRDPVQDSPSTHISMQDTFSSVYAPNIQRRANFECSIIIPVFNRVELTRQCLIHVAEVTDGCLYEVIVVDNGSTDDTKAFLSTLDGDIQVISNPGNYGFAKACNQGAAAAKGRYLVFLNNDTIPKQGWLRALVNEVERHQDVAVVGSKLLYPDDTIQHAGVVFSKNCLTPYHVFRGAPGDLQAATIRQEFQVVTAACMLIRREEFDAVGGFDEIYQNGFEDVDLCLKVGKRGKKIIYQPESVLYHLEHQTPGRKDPETERHNGKVLMERWASSIVVDEDLYTVPAGYANRYYFRDGWLRQSLEPFQSDGEKTQWKRVQRVQELLLSQRYDTTQGLKAQNDRELHALLSDCQEWPEDGEVLRWAAKLCQSLQLDDGARAFLKRTLSLGEHREAREQLATLALKGKDLPEAAQHIQALLRSDPNDGSGHWLQGILLMQSQQCAEATRSFRRAVQCRYDPRKAGIGLGMACMGIGDVEEAWRVFESVVTDYPDDAEAMNWLIQSGTSLQRWEGLGQRLSHYVERNPADCDMRFALAGVEFRAGRMDSAQRQFEILHLFKPDYEGLTDLRALLQTATIDTHALAT